MDNSRSYIGATYRDVLEQLQDSEPSTVLEAQAVLKQIRVSKGYLDPVVIQDLNQMRASSRETVLQAIGNRMEIEAAYTKKFGS